MSKYSFTCYTGGCMYKLPSTSNFFSLKPCDYKCVFFSHFFSSSESLDFLVTPTIQHSLYKIYKCRTRKELHQCVLSYAILGSIYNERPLCSHSLHILKPLSAIIILLKGIWSKYPQSTVKALSENLPRYALLTNNIYNKKYNNNNIELFAEQANKIFKVL